MERVWLINLFARLQQPDKAYDYVRTLISRSMHSNLFGDHPPFQIDANFGGTAGLVEMLPRATWALFSLPALPKAWAAGSVRGLKARGGFIVDMEWSEGILTSARVISTHGRVCRISCSVPLAVKGKTEVW